MISGKFYTRNGEPVFIRNVDDFAALVEREISDEAGEMVRELADQADMTQQRIQSDLNSYESQLDDQTRAFREIDDKTAQLLDIIRSSTMAESVRKQLLLHLKAIESELANQTM